MIHFHDATKSTFLLDPPGEAKSHYTLVLCGQLLVKSTELHFKFICFNLEALSKETFTKVPNAVYHAESQRSAYEMLHKTSRVFINQQSNKKMFLMLTKFDPTLKLFNGNFKGNFKGIYTDLCGFDCHTKQLMDTLSVARIQLVSFQLQQ